MTVAWYRFRRTFGRRGVGYLGAVVLIALLGGVSLASLAGARRTASAFHRFLAASNPSDLAIDAGPYDQQMVDKFTHFPQVIAAQSYVAFDVAPLDADGAPILDQSVMAGEWVGSMDGLYFDQDRFSVTQGRMADPTRVDEVVISESMAKLSGYQLGQRIDVGVFDDAEVNQSGAGTDSVPRSKDRVTVEVVGIGLFTDEVVQDEVDRIPRVLSTPAFTKRALPWATYAWTGLRLQDGAADVAAVKQQYLEVLPPEYPHFFRVTSITETQGQRAIRPQAVALGIFGGIALLATLLLAGQALARQLRLERDDLEQLRAMGAGPATTSVQGLFGAILVIVAGTALAATVAVAVSPLTPIGPVRRVEVSPGISFDWAVLGAGAAVLVLMLAGIATLVAWRQAPHRVASRPGLRADRPSWMVRAGMAVGLSVAAVAGIRQAVLPGQGRSSVPSRSVMTGAAVAIVAMVASLTFASSLDTLVAHPRLFGWDWDEMLLASAGYGNVPRARTDEVLAADPDIAAWSGVYFGSLELDGLNVPVIGAETHAAVAPPVLSGRALEAADEVVLGEATLEQIHKAVGDTVTLAGDSGPVTLRVVGTATLPTIGIGHGSHASMGSGALLDYSLIPGYARNITAQADEGPNAVLVRFRPGTDLATDRAHLADHAGELATLSNSIEATGVQHPAEIVNSEDMGSAPAALAGGLLGAALLSLALALLAAVRRRRRELALLKALGFTRRQLMATVMWQATVIVALGSLIGVPVGIVIGQALWTVFAEQLHAVVQPSVPLGAIAVVTLGALIVSILVAALPGRAAARIPTSELLRSE